MQWFGVRRGAHAPGIKTVPAPVGEPCLWCEEPIAAGDCGILLPHLPDHGGAAMRPWHAACHIRTIVGGANHQQGTCSCCGGDQDPDPPGLTRREAALLAAKKAGYAV